MIVLPFEEISASDVGRVGGKGANLGEMTRAGFAVPPGFCVTTDAYDAFMANADQDALDACLEVEGGAAAVREALSRLPMPPAVASEIVARWKYVGEHAAYAVRSSATAEDLPDASFAGQQDTYLNIQGEPALLDAVKRCWISLYTDRAVLYRARNHFAHRDVKLSVVVQRMVFPEISGIMFTADPISGRRGTASIEASYGLGEALVSGIVNADLYRLDKETREVLGRTIGDKAIAIRPLPSGGTREEAVPDDQRTAQVLDAPALEALLSTGVAIERHYGQPQDIEWCIEAGRLFILQSRPITTLFPLPADPADGARIYVSFGHVQMMTNAMPPLAIDVWKRVLPVQRDRGSSQAVKSAAGRIFLDLTPLLRPRVARRAMLAVFGRVYPAMRDGLAVLTSRASFARDAGRGWARPASVLGFAWPVIRQTMAIMLGAAPVAARRRVETSAARWLANAQARMAGAETPAARLAVADELMRECFREAFLMLASVIPSGVIANALLQGAFGSRASPEDLAAIDRGLPGNVTTEMELAVGDLMDIVAAHPEIEATLRRDPNAVTEPAFTVAWNEFLARYGMRGPGEVDISRPRYRDDPRPIVSMLLSGRAGRGPGAHRRKHEALTQEAERAAERIVQSARYGIFGALRAAWTRRLIVIARNGMAMREHPKFLLVKVFQLVRDAVLEAGYGQDVFFRTFAEIAARAPIDVNARAEALRRDAQKAPPLMMASDGEIPILPRPKDLPDGALAGTAASSGVVEGIAHVVHDPAKEALADGEILVAPHTDPGWTPLFVHAAALVTEVGGLITHGSVVAREYGIPAVVSVANATSRIRTGQRIRVDGTRGIVEMLE